jgi:very-short-patch-repair endonuclease
LFKNLTRAGAMPKIIESFHLKSRIFYMEYSTLEKLLSQGFSLNEIAKMQKVCLSTVRYWAKKFKLNSKHKSIKNRSPEEHKECVRKLNERKLKKHFDWISIQKDHYEGLTWKELRKKYSISFATLVEAQKNGLFKSINKEEKDKRARERQLAINYSHSDESKKKISLARKRYLNENPDKHGWSNSKHHRSIPCELLKERLKQEEFSFQEEFKPLLHKQRFFSIDIYLPDLKLGIEVNGRQHYSTNGELAPYYQQRHDLICQEGYELIEIQYHKVFQNTFLEELIKDLKFRQSRIEREPGTYQVELFIREPALP